MGSLQSASAMYLFNPTDDPLLTAEQAAEYIGVTRATLSVWRCTKRYNLAYIKVGRLVRYRKSGCDAFLQSRTIEA